MLIHCQAGKDRTGFVCAILLWALGVPMAEIRRDYLRSSGKFARTEYMASMLRQAFHDDIPARVVDVAAVLGDVRAEFLDATFDQIVRDHGSMPIWSRLRGWTRGADGSYGRCCFRMLLSAEST
ncbi:hypothetical protein HND72_18675 [Pseudomonas putida]|nr:hypothetical protein [Pseudomonas putida]